MDPIFLSKSPRLLSHYSQDPDLINAYKNGKDLYATIGIGVYKNKYEDNLEHHADGSINVEGKKRRSNMKKLLLGLMYSKGTKSTAEDLNCSMEEAQNIIDSFFNAYPKVKEWINEKETFAKTYGYVENLAGRKRRLPDLLLPKFSVSYINKDQSIPSDFNPLIGSLGIISLEKKDDLISKYKEKINNAKRKADIEAIIAEAARQGIRIVNNGAFIAQAHRQIVNAAIQSAAADITKNAMIQVYNNKDLRELGFKLLITVHDELIGECPEENAEKAAKLLSQIMIDSAAELCSVPMKCDAEIEKAWYEGEHASVIREDYEKLVNKLGDKNAALNQIYSDYCECLPEEINQILNIA